MKDVLDEVTALRNHFIRSLVEAGKVSASPDFTTARSLSDGSRMITLLVSLEEEPNTNGKRSVRITLGSQDRAEEIFWIRDHLQVEAKFNVAKVFAESALGVRVEAEHERVAAK